MACARGHRGDALRLVAFGGADDQEALALQCQRQMGFDEVQVLPQRSQSAGKAPTVASESAAVAKDISTWPTGLNTPKEVGGDSWAWWGLFG